MSQFGFGPDILKYASQSNFPATGESNKLYVATNNNTIFHYNTNQYCQLGGDTSALAPKASPVFTGSISLSRLNNSTVGDYSVAVGYGTVASGSNTIASGYNAEATESSAHAFGYGVKATTEYSTVVGIYNIVDQSYSNTSAWAQNTNYAAGDYAILSTVNETTLEIENNKYICTTAHNSGTTQSLTNWMLSPQYAFIVGNGSSNSDRWNAFAVDWSGNGYFMGDVYVGSDFKTTLGSKVATEAYVTTALANFSGGISGVKLISTSLIPDANGIVTIPAMTGATSSAAGSTGLVPAPTTSDAGKFLAGDGTWKDGGKPMVILSYGSSTWAEFEAAYNNNVIVYCRASSNSNPATGSQTRMAFMAYVNNATTPTNVEFQYYRSVNSHSATQMGDQVFVYKLDKTSGWSVTTREASIKEINVASGSKLGVSWSSNKVTLSNTMTADDMPMSSSDATTTKAAIDTLNSNTVPVRLTITLGDNLTLLRGWAQRIGDLVIVNIQLRSSATIAAGSHLFKLNGIDYGIDNSGNSMSGQLNMIVSGNSGAAFFTSNDHYFCSSSTIQEDKEIDIIGCFVRYRAGL